MVMAAHPGLGLAEADRSVFAEAAKQVISGLRIENGARQLLEAEQVHGLLVEFVHGGAARFTGGQQQRGGGKADGRGLLQPLQKQRQGQSRGGGGGRAAWASRPDSLAGSSSVAAAKRMGAACCSRSKSSARARAAGWAGTTAGVNRSGAKASEPSQGARTSTPVSWSSAPERSSTVEPARSA